MRTFTAICFAALLAAAVVPLANAWLPSFDKIRGVNLGGMFIVEPWMMADEWNLMGCSDKPTEYDCVMKLGQAQANAAFQAHWNRWITQDDIGQIASLGLNTIRIPLGFWIYEDLVDRTKEYFPQGGFLYLERLCGWAKSAGLYIILDLHGAPGAQSAFQPFTGENSQGAGFFGDGQFERAYKWLEWITNMVHVNPNFGTVGTIELLNEPSTNPVFPSLVQTYYPTAFGRIRGVEGRLGTAPANFVHIQMMDRNWGAGDPNTNLPDKYFSLFDDHSYATWNPAIPATRDAYMRAFCHDDPVDNAPLVVGEWSLGVRDVGGELSLSSPGAVDWYRKWWGAQVLSYERSNGWVYWAWKVNWAMNNQDNLRWGYQQAVAAGIIPRNPKDVYSWNVCAGY